MSENRSEAMVFTMQAQLQEAQGRIRELEAQVEQMKCCGNCDNSIRGNFCGDFPCPHDNYSHWQPKEAGKWHGGL